VLPDDTRETSVTHLFGDAPVWAPFWGAFGSFDRTAHVSEEVGFNEADPGAYIKPTLLWVYLFITIIVLVNLLIAQMSDTYARVTEKGQLVWLFERAQLISEFKDTKPPAPPPFNVMWLVLVTFPYKVYKSYRERVLGEVAVSPGGFRQVPPQQQLSLVRQREGEALKRSLQAREKRVEETLEARIERVQAKLVKIEEQNRANFESINGRFDKLNPTLLERL